MLKLIAWALAVYSLVQLWAGVRARQRVRDRSGEAEAQASGIDRSQVVDAEFTDMDEGRERGE